MLRSLESVANRDIAHRAGGRRKGDPAILVADSSRIQLELGWRPRHSALEDMVGDAMRWEMSRRAQVAAAASN